MITALEKRVRADLADIRAMIVTSTAIRSLLAGPKQHDPEIGAIAAGAPASASWAVYEHCAAVTRLYAIYERFVEDLAAEWLSQLPVLWPSYADLGNRIRRTHIEGVGRILSTLHYRRHRHVDPIALIDGLRRGLSEASYSVAPEAVIHTERNYQPEVLSEFLNAIGIEDAWSWVDGHGAVEQHLANSTRPDQTLENALMDFVNYRNDAAHGLVDELLGVDALMEFVSLVDAVSTALAELVRNRIVEGLVRMGSAICVGTITDVLPKAGAVVAQCTQGTIVRGDRLIVCGRRVCREVPIVSIQVDGRPCDGLSVIRDMEAGLALGDGMRRTWRLIKLLPIASHGAGSLDAEHHIVGSLWADTPQVRPSRGL